MMRIRNKILALGCIAAAAGGLLSSMACNTHEIEPFAQSLVAGKKQLMGAGSARPVDILFVIDNSNSMMEEQQNLDENFGIFIQKLMDAGADFRIGVVTTDDAITAPNLSFSTNAIEKNSGFWDNNPALREKKTEILKTCSDYFSDHVDWIQSRDIDEKMAASGISDRNEYVRTLFRCAAMAGVGGAPIERGLSTMWKSLASYLGSGVDDVNRFKRPSSILSIVFVTDENDCSDIYSYKGSIVRALDNKPVSSTADYAIPDTRMECENKRNIEDSCTIAKRDAIIQNGEDGTSLSLSNGQALEYEGETRMLRAWCVDGSETARKALCKCLIDHKKFEECIAGDGDNCPDDCAAADNIQYDVSKCDENTYESPHQLVTRDYYFNKVLNYVIDSNRTYYQKGREDLKDMRPGEFAEEVKALAKADVIVASIINRDAGVRYDGTFPENWCGSAGTQSYRYQMFGDMFDNDAIYAPICCSNEVFTASKKVAGNDTEVCGLTTKSGDPSNFGPVLGLIGQRIGEAVNTICTEAPPLSCNIEDCNEEISDGVYDPVKPRSNPNGSCGCVRGCDGAHPYLANTDRQYYVCNEFRVGISTAPMNGDIPDISDPSKITAMNPESYKVEMESNYCYIRTGSPIQINLSNTEPGKGLIIEFPKKTGNI